MRIVRPSVPTVVASLALGVAVASYAMPRPGSAEIATPVPAAMMQAQRAVFTTAARVASLEGRADAAEARLAQAQRDLALLQRDYAAFKTHRHTYTNGMPGFGIVNLATLKQMLDRMAPSDARGALMIAYDGVRLPSSPPQTGAAFVP